MGWRQALWGPLTLSNTTLICKLVGTISAVRIIALGTIFRQNDANPQSTMNVSLVPLMHRRLISEQAAN
jgi:hypothetical protein